MHYLREYQRKFGLESDGLFGRQTCSHMADNFKMKELTVCYMVGQVRVESAEFTAGRENMNYSADRIRTIFKRLATTHSATSLAHNPKALGDAVYGGYEWRGGGGLQVTWKENWQAFFEFCGLPENTDTNSVCSDPELWWMTAVWYFKRKSVEEFIDGRIDRQVCDCVSNVVNRGSFHSKRPALEQDRRWEYTKMALGCLKN